MNRSDFYARETVDAIVELDFLHNPLSSFSMTYGLNYYRVTSSDLMRPDLISYKCYGTVEFWWVLMLVNSIDCPLSDLSIGQILVVPNKIDIYNFQKKFRIIS